MALKAAGLSKFMVEELWELDVFNVDAMQGRENYCIFFDPVIALEQKCMRITVAVSRAHKGFSIVNGINVLRMAVVRIPYGMMECVGTAR